jgi:hypothetical protein
VSEPKRWLDEGPPEAVEHLLRAAAAERPPEQSLARTLTVLGVGASATGAAGAAGAATTGAATAGALGAGSAAKATGILVTSAWVKWGVVVTAVTAAGVAGNAVRTRVRLSSSSPAHALVGAAGIKSAERRVVAKSPEPNSVPMPAGLATGEAAEEPAPDPSVAAEPVPRLNAAPVPVARNAPELAPSRSVAKAPQPVVEEPPPAVEAPPVNMERLAEEVALVDRARGALAQGDAAGALVALDAYDASFKEHRFAPEALYLRMEALLRAGRPAAARSVADVLARTYPRSPNAARARQVLAETIP